MTNEKTTGIVLGLLVCAVVVAGNVLRADPHLVSVYPNMFSVAIAPMVVYVLDRRRRLGGASPDDIRVFGVRVGAIAGAVFAVGLGLFTLYWVAAWPLGLFGSGTAFGSVFLLSCFAAYAASQKRIIAV